jgi:hypothetical protein
MLTPWAIHDEDSMYLDKMPKAVERYDSSQQQFMWERLLPLSMPVLYFSVPASYLVAIINQYIAEIPS